MSEGEPCPRCGKPDAAGACACWDTAKSEDRTLSPPGWKWSIDSGPSALCKSCTRPKARALLAQAWAHHDAIAKPAYDRGFAAGRAAERAEVAALASRWLTDLNVRRCAAGLVALQGDGCTGQALHMLAVAIRSRGSEAIEAHNERMREEGRAEMLAAVREWLLTPALSQPVKAGGGITLPPPDAEMLAHALPDTFFTGADALAKREAAAEERGYERGCGDANEVVAENSRRLARILELERRILELEAEVGSTLHDVRHARDVANKMRTERDALRADVARRERAAAKTALEEAADALNVGTETGFGGDGDYARWLRERAAAL